jgi:FkbM family methyltransferase
LLAASPFLGVSIRDHAPRRVKRYVRSARRVRRSAFEAAGSERYSALAYAGMDRAILKLAGPGGTFLEAGGGDGIRVSNTYLLERFYGWRGVLVEAIPWLYRDCVRNRPRSMVVHAALTRPGVTEVRIADHDLLSSVDPAGVPVPGRTLSSVLDEAEIERLDLLSLDVEGSEEAALAGLDLDRHAPTWLLLEMHDYDQRHEIIEEELLRGLYQPLRWLSHLDVLYRLRA